MRESLVFKTTLLILSMACTPAMANPNMTSTTDTHAFSEILQKELTNRATAREAIEAITAPRLKPDARLFWETYAQLEVLNLHWYTPVAVDLQPEPATLSAWLKGRSAALYYCVAPERMLKRMAKAISSYYEELQATTPKVAVSQRTFYQYVLDQERAQVQAFAMAAAGDYHSASKHLNAFLTDH